MNQLAHMTFTVIDESAPRRHVPTLHLRVQIGGSSRSTSYEHTPNMRYGLLKKVQETERETGEKCGAQGVSFYGDYVWLGVSGGWSITLTDYDCHNLSLNDHDRDAAQRRRYSRLLWHARHNGRQDTGLLSAPPANPARVGGAARGHRAASA